MKQNRKCMQWKTHNAPQASDLFDFLDKRTHLFPTQHSNRFFYSRQGYKDKMVLFYSIIQAKIWFFGNLVIESEPSFMEQKYKKQPIVR